MAFLGSLGSALGGIAKKTLRAAIGVAGGIAGGPVGAIAGSAITGAVERKLLGSGGSRPGPGPTQLAPWNPPGLQLPGGLTLDFPGFGRPGMGLTSTGARRGRVQMVNGQCPKGYHPNKTKTAQGDAARSFCVRNRRVNYGNGRAAQRAGRRLKGTVKMLRKSFTLVAPHAPKGKWIPKGRKK